MMVHQSSLHDVVFNESFERSLQARMLMKSLCMPDILCLKKMFGTWMVNAHERAKIQIRHGLNTLFAHMTFMQIYMNVVMCTSKA